MSSTYSKSGKNPEAKEPNTGKAMAARAMSEMASMLIRPVVGGAFADDVLTVSPFRKRQLSLSAQHRFPHACPEKDAPPDAVTEDTSE